MRHLLFCLLLAPLLASAQLPETDWLALMPEDDQRALEAMPEISHDSPEGDGTFTAGGLKQRDPGLPAVMYSNHTVAALQGKTIRIGGYPVPLETDTKGRSTLFFLVPYPGACIHVPPPPSNQIVHIFSEMGVRVEDLYQPYWIEGKMQVRASSSELADAGYQMEAEKIYAYELR